MLTRRTTSTLLFALCLGTRYSSFHHRPTASFLLASAQQPLTPLDIATRTQMLKQASTSIEPLQEQKVIPDVLSEFTPRVQIHLSYDKGVEITAPGKQLKPQEAVHMPIITLEGTEENKYYTILMSDPDAPSPDNPTRREWLHLIITNIKGGPSTTKGIDGDQIVPYAPPTPPQGNHRYVFSLYEQPDRLSINGPEARGNFNTKAFAKEEGLTLVGANFFKAAHQKK